MHVVLVQPPDAPQNLQPVLLSGEGPALLAPPWKLLCLRSHILEHTRHLCTVIDCRRFSDLERQLGEGIRSTPESRVLVINTVSHALGQAASVLAIAKRNFPAMKTAVCGEFPSQFPAQAAAFAHADYGLAGDPEPILRNLLDYMDVEQRLHRVPGLLCQGAPNPAPYWLPKLHSLTLPNWEGVDWEDYQPSPGAGQLRAEARLSRGHSRLPADRAHGEAHEPLRLWPMDRLALVLQKCAHRGATEVLLTDPPGVWTPQTLDAWCRALTAIHNTQPWGLQLLPTWLSEETVEAMAYTQCRRLDFIFPSCDPAILQRYGCILAARDLAACMEQLAAAGIRVYARFWMGGPEEGRGEPARVAAMLRELGYGHASLHPFPFFMDSPLYEELAASADIPHLEDWIQWSRDPWTLERPVALWGGPPAIAQLAADFAEVERLVGRSPGRLLRRLARALRSRNWITAMEDKALGLITPTSPPQP